MKCRYDSVRHPASKQSTSLQVGVVCLSPSHWSPISETETDDTGALQPPAAGAARQHIIMSCRYTALCTLDKHTANRGSKQDTARILYKGLLAAACRVLRRSYASCMRVAWPGVALLVAGPAHRSGTAVPTLLLRVLSSDGRAERLLSRTHTLLYREGDRYTSSDA